MLKALVGLAVIVQFLAVSAGPALAAAETPRGTWMAEWLRPEVTARTMGVLRLRDGKLSFVEQTGQTDWELDLATVKRVAIVGRSISIVVKTGEEYVVAIMQPNLTQGSPKQAFAMIERAIRALATGSPSQ